MAQPRRSLANYNLASNVKREQEYRRFRRTREYGPQKISVAYNSPGGMKGDCEAKLWDFSEGGLGMDSPRSFEPGEVVQIVAELKGSAYSMQLTAKARVAYCRKTDRKTYRVGVAFLDVAYRPILG